MSTLSKQELRKLAYIKPGPGSHISGVIAEMIDRANTHNIRVTCVFNEAQFTVEPGMDVDEAYQLWFDETQRKGDQWRRSMKAEVSRREQKAREEDALVRREEVYAMLEEEGIDVPWYKRFGFNKVVRINSSDPYGAAAVDYAIAWAVAMQRAMREGHALEDVAEELSYYVNYDGITGFQHGCAVGFLSRFWRHGQQLRKWHNLSHQIHDEGEAANRKRNAILNPAIIVVGKK